MRVYITTIMFVLSGVEAVYANDPQTICNNYASLSTAEAEGEYQRLLALSMALDSKVNKYINAGVPQTDPEFSRAGKKLGDAIGQSYALCKCNSSLAKSENCKAFMAHLNQTELTN